MQAFEPLNIMKIVTTLIMCTSVALMVTGCSKSGKPGQEAGANAEEKDQQIADLRKQLAQAKAEASRAPRVEVVEA